MSFSIQCRIQIRKEKPRLHLLLSFISSSLPILRSKASLKGLLTNYEYITVNGPLTPL